MGGGSRAARGSIITGQCSGPRTAGLTLTGCALSCRLGSFPECYGKGSGPPTALLTAAVWTAYSLRVRYSVCVGVGVGVRSWAGACFVATFVSPWRALHVACSICLTRLTQVAVSKMKPLRSRGGVPACCALYECMSVCVPCPLGVALLQCCPSSLFCCRMQSLPAVCAGSLVFRHIVFTCCYVQALLLHCAASLFCLVVWVMPAGCSPLSVLFQACCFSTACKATGAFI